MRIFGARLGLPALVALTLAITVIAFPAGASAASCGARTTAPVFAPWLDPGLYFRAPNGGFESGTAGWTLRGGAQVVAGNETFQVGGATETRSVAIPAGGSAESSTLCVDGDEPTLRFFARNNGSPLSTLVVEAHVRTTLLGLQLEKWLPVGVVPGTATTWQPSLPMLIDLSANQLLGGTTAVAFRFTPLLADGSWQVDDVYLDPFKDR